MLDDILNLMFELIIVLLDLLQPMFFVAFQLLVDLKDALDFFFLGRDDVLQDGDLVLVVGSEVGLSLQVGLSFLGELAVVVPGQFFNASAVAVIILLQLITQVSVLIDEPGDLSFSFLSTPLESVVSLLDLMLLLLDLIGKPLDLSLMQILELILILLMLSDEIILHVLVFSLN